MATRMRADRAGVIVWKVLRAAGEQGRSMAGIIVDSANSGTPLTYSQAKNGLTWCNHVAVALVGRPLAVERPLGEAPRHVLTDDVSKVLRWQAERLRDTRSRMVTIAVRDEASATYFGREAAGPDLAAALTEAMSKVTAVHDELVELLNA